jgi:DNA-binding transcriptional LysR family regulator
MAEQVARMIGPRVQRFAAAGGGVIQLFEEWLRPHLDSGALEPVLEPWWESFPGPFLYYSGRRLVPAPLRAFIDHIRAMP